MSADDHRTAWSEKSDRGKQVNSPETKVIDGGEFLSKPPSELEASMRRRYTLLNSLDLLNTLVLEDADLS